MNFKHFSVILIALALSGCKQERHHLTRIEAKQIPVSDTIPIDSSIEDFIKPYRDHVNNDLDSVIAYSKDTYSKRDGEFNTAIGNFMADVIYEQANPVFNKRTGKSIDLVLLNHGGIRSIISKGNITTRTAFEIMPFENSIVVVALKAPQIDSLVHYLGKEKRAHPIQGLKLVLGKDYNVAEATVNGSLIDPNRTYYVATNDYLYNGGDRMNFFKTNDSLYILDYKIRSAMIDYFKKVDTISPVKDDRFIKLN